MTHSEDIKMLVLHALNTIIEHERKHFNFYLQASMTLKGRSRLFFLPFLEKEVTSELAHIKIFGDKIAALGGTPSTVNHSYPNSLTCMNDILTQAIAMEREILGIYHGFYADAERYADAHKDMSIVLMLEEQIEDSTKDVEEMEKMIQHGSTTKCSA